MAKIAAAAELLVLLGEPSPCIQSIYLGYVGCSCTHHAIAIQKSAPAFECEFLLTNLVL